MKKDSIFCVCISRIYQMKILSCWDEISLSIRLVMTWLKILCLQGMWAPHFENDVEPKDKILTRSSAVASPVRIFLLPLECAPLVSFALRTEHSHKQQLQGYIYFLCPWILYSSRKEECVCVVHTLHSFV